MPEAKTAKIMSKNIFIFYILLYTASVWSVTNNYGDFKVKVTDYAIKFESRAKPVIDLDFKVVESNDTFAVYFSTRIKKPLGVIGIKLRSYVWNETLQKFALSFNMNVKNVCQNRISKQLVTLIAGLEDNCQVKVGTFNFTITDFNAFIHVVANDKFFYGRYLGITDIFAKGYGRLFRSNVTVVFEPLN